MDFPPQPEFDKGVQEILHLLPLPLRTYVIKEGYTPVVRSLMTKYSLHVDQGTVLEREVLFLLLGIDNPDVFMETLVEEGGFDQEMLPGLMEDLNEQIFIPLRQEMEHGTGTAGEAAPAPQAPVEHLSIPVGMQPAPVLPNPAVGAPLSPLPPPAPIPTFPPPPRPPQFAASNYIPDHPLGTYAPPPQSPSYPNQESGNLSSYMHTVAPPPPPHIVNKIPPQPITAHTAPPTPPVTEKPLDTGHLLKDHEELSPSFKPAQQAAEGMAHIAFDALSKKVPSPLAPSAAPTSQNLPGTLPAMAVPTGRSLPRPIFVSGVKGPATTMTTPRSYSVDPYREPIDQGK